MTTSKMIVHDPLSLLRAGKDTVEIAAFLGCRECTAYNEIYRLKEAERAPKAENRKKPDSQKIPYAGRPKRSGLPIVNAE